MKTTHVNSQGRLERIDEGVSNRSGSRGYRQTGQPGYLPTNLVGVPGAFKHTDLEAITSQSNKLEESVKDPSRPP